MQVTNDALKIIVHYETGGKPEKFLKAYYDKFGKVWTIGIGSTIEADGTSVDPGDVITLEEAYQLLDKHINEKILPGLAKLIPNAKQNQIDAVVSLVYNIGIEAFSNSTIYRFIKENKPPEEITRAFAMWKKSGGIVLPGLVKRRRSEAELYNTGIVKLY